MKQVQLAIIGGGPAGLAAAIAAREKGVEDILIIERDKELGGILNQCIHAGFGLHTFGQELTGPEYAGRFISRCSSCTSLICCAPWCWIFPGTGCLPSPGRKRAHSDTSPGGHSGYGLPGAPPGALNIPGYRPAGIYSAGTAQRLVNMEGFMPGKNVVILGSGDIGLIMARRMTLEGAKVHAVAEVLPYSGGLKRNIVQCLEDFDIPLYLSTTVVDIHGRERLEGVTLARVDENRRPIPGTEQYIPCDTLLLSVGLLPENELSSAAGVHLSGVTGGPEVTDRLATSIPGVFACGNVLHVHDLVDFVSQEAQRAGENAAPIPAGCPGRQPLPCVWRGKTACATPCPNPSTRRTWTKPLPSASGWRSPIGMPPCAPTPTARSCGASPSAFSPRVRWSSFSCAGQSCPQAAKPLPLP